MSAAQVVALVSLVVLVPLLALAALPLLQTIAALTGRARAQRAVDSLARPRVAILVPAHDEAGGIAATLASLVPQLGDGDRLIVIADNCSDDTATIARRCGVEAVERVDATRRGKGYALAHGLVAVAARAPSPDVLLTFDADCVAHPGCVHALAREARATRRPVQSRYLLRAADDGVRARLSEFALRLRNWIRPLGMRRMGLPCPLTGSGMGFDWSIVKDADFASGHLAEDLQLGLAFARRGLAPLFAADAIVDSRLASDTKSANIQRTRWEHGHLGLLVAEVPRLVATALRRRDLALLFVAWDLAVPPFALFVAIELIVLALSCALWLAGGPAWPAGCASIALAMTATTMVLAQRGFARDLIDLREIVVSVPLYLLRKVPVYLRFVVRRERSWVRTKRDSE